MTREPSPRRRAPRIVLGGLAAAALVLLPAVPAAAHVTVGSVEPNGDGTSRITFTFDHGCDGEATDAVRVTMPAGVEALAAGQPDGWTADVSADAVSWEGEPVPDGERAELTLDVRAEGEIGHTFVFPTEQECPSGEVLAWTDADPTGAYPAPTFVGTAATLAPASAAGAAPDAPAGGTSTPLGPLAVGVVVLAVAAGAAGGWAARRRASTA
ncbi:DUF1775 domain-containing protein [Cellulosimicrobium arenosum]|uniref:DUF1775 domain-containing protein n=1 Tax=Cellulosimicrobium arenosum TaxID=2708133 RepID=A0A927J0I4_9MICO|nr:DUF1775 domain-containing protein [Cellulosimicrobium arenosum]MBD8079618.1 DUF1775 domain-containing protein [Cellulosimicrobium arenosum]